MGLKTDKQSIFLYFDEKKVEIGDFKPILWQIFKILNIIKA